MPRRASLVVHVLCEGSVLARHDVYAAAFAVEFDFAIDEREERVIAALTDAFAGMELGAELPHDDVAGDNFLAAVTLNTASLAVGIATVAAGTLTLFYVPWDCLFELNRKRMDHACAK